MKNHRGLFITFESTKEGLGKTTQATLLAESLRRDGYEVVLTKESGGTDIGQQIRQILKYSKHDLSKATELFLQLADRAQHYKEVLKPSLKEGKIVISDRYFDSTLIYQGAGRGWKNALLWRLHHATTGSLLPDLTYVLDGESFRAMDSNDRFEREGTLFFEKVRNAMLHLTTKDNRYVLLNANVDAGVLAKQIRSVIDDRKLLELVKLPKL